MRDHPQHGVPLLGSGWGTRLDLGVTAKVRTGRVKETVGVREAWRRTWAAGLQDKMLWAERNDYGPDQGFLKRSD